MPTRKRQASKRKVQEPAKEAVETKKEKLGMRCISIYSYKFFCITVVNHAMSVSSAIKPWLLGTVQQSGIVRYTCFKISKWKLYNTSSAILSRARQRAKSRWARHACPTNPQIIAANFLS